MLTQDSDLTPSLPPFVTLVCKSHSPPFLNCEPICWTSNISCDQWACHIVGLFSSRKIFTPNIDLPTDSYISSSLQVNISATSLNTPPSSTFPSETSTLPFPPLPQKPLNSSPSSAHSPTLQVFSSLPLSEMLKKMLRYFKARLQNNISQRQGCDIAICIPPLLQT